MLNEISYACKGCEIGEEEEVRYPQNAGLAFAVQNFAHKCSKIEKQLQHKADNIENRGSHKHHCKI